MSDYVSDYLGIPEPKSIALPVLRQSVVKSFEKCPRYGLFSRLGLRRWGRTRAFDTGTYGHTVMRVMAMGGSTKEAIADCQAQHQTLLGDLAQHPAFGGKVSNIKESEIEDREKDLNLGIVTGLAAMEQLKPRIACGSLVIVGSEVPIDGFIECPTLTNDTTFRVQTSLDLVAKDREGRVVLPDLKTADDSEDFDALFANSMRRAQTWISTLGARASGISAWAMQYIGVKKAGLRRYKPSKQRPLGETLQEYIDRVREWHAEENAAGRPTCVVNPPMPVPETLPHTLGVRFAVVRDWLRCDTGWHQYYPVEANCKSVYGECTYAGLCNKDPSSWRKVIEEGSYTFAKDPLDADKDRRNNQEETV